MFSIAHITEYDLTFCDEHSLTKQYAGVEQLIVSVVSNVVGRWNTRTSSDVNGNYTVITFNFRYPDSMYRERDI